MIVLWILFNKKKHWNKQLYESLQNLFICLQQQTFPSIALCQHPSNLKFNLHVPQQTLVIALYLHTVTSALRHTLFPVLKLDQGARTAQNTMCKGEEATEGRIARANLAIYKKRVHPSVSLSNSRFHATMPQKICIPI